MTVMPVALKLASIYSHARSKDENMSYSGSSEVKIDQKHDSDIRCTC